MPGWSHYGEGEAVLECIDSEDEEGVLMIEGKGI